MKKLGSVKLALPVPPTDASRTRPWSSSILRGNPYSGEAADAVEGIRERLHAIAPGGLLGGIPAENYDIEQTNAHDTQADRPAGPARRRPDPGRGAARPGRARLPDRSPSSSPSPATLGLCTFAFSELGERRDRLQPRPALLPIPGRPRGRLQHLPDGAGARGGGRAAAPARGRCVALVNTGGVVTGAGLILAGTFATLTLLPLEELVQIGATVAIGVLLDTFVVRALLIPAITYRLGERPGGRLREAGAARPRRRPSVAGARLHLLALGGVGAALLLQRLAGLLRCRRRGGRSARG